MTQTPDGIEHAVDTGVADSDTVDPDPDTDLQTPDTQRRDPDDPEAAMRESVEQSRGD